MLCCFFHENAWVNMLPYRPPVATFIAHALQNAWQPHGTLSYTTSRRLHARQFSALSSSAVPARGETRE